MLRYVQGTHHKNEMVAIMIGHNTSSEYQMLSKWFSITWHFIMEANAGKRLVSSVQPINETNSIKIKTKFVISTLDFIFINNVPTTTLMSH
jgi:hypothetical protein